MRGKLTTQATCPFGRIPWDHLLPLGDRDGVSSLSEKDALFEVVVAQGRLLQALTGESQIEVETGPHLTQFPLGQHPWRNNSFRNSVAPLGMGFSGAPALYPISH